MSLLSIRTFFKYFIYNPNSSHLTNEEKKTVFYAQGFFYYATLTLIPRLCRWMWSRNNVWNTQERERLFLTEFGNGSFQLLRILMHRQKRRPKKERQNTHPATALYMAFI
jgi:hypothetical protein